MNVLFPKAKKKKKKKIMAGGYMNEPEITTFKEFCPSVLHLHLRKYHSVNKIFS